MSKRHPIPHFPGYKATKDGRCFSYKRARTKGKEIGAKGANGRKSCSMRCDLNGHVYFLGRARYILLTFRGAPGNLTIPEYLELSKPGTGKKQVPWDARHLDGDHTNDSLSNLAWGTRKDNCQDALRLKENPIYKLTEKDKLKICDLYDSGKWKQIELAELYDCTQANISHTVNKWDHPLRTPVKDRKEFRDLLPKETVIHIANLLEGDSLTYDEIGEKTDTTRAQVIHINLGDTYSYYLEDDVTFPIRSNRHQTLTQQKADEIRSRNNDDVKEIADEYGVSASTVYAIWAGRRWNG